MQATLGLLVDTPLVFWRDRHIVCLVECFLELDSCGPTAEELENIFGNDCVWYIL